MRRKTRVALRPHEVEFVKLMYNATPNLETQGDISIFLRNLGQSMSDSELSEILSDTCHKPGVHMTQERVIRLMETLKCRHFDSIVPDTVEAFAALGGRKDRQGGVDVDILRGAVQAFELTIDIDAMIREVDTDMSGFIEYEEFSTMFDSVDQERRRSSTASGEAQWGQRMLRTSIPSFSQLLPAAVLSRNSLNGNQQSAVKGKAVGMAAQVESKHDIKAELREGHIRDAPTSLLSEMANLRERLRDVNATERLVDPHTRPYRADMLVAVNDPNKGPDDWARRQVMSRSVAFIGRSAAPQRSGGMRYTQTPCAINHKPKVHTTCPQQLHTALRASTPNPIGSTEIRHQVHTKLVRNNRLCPCTMTSSRFLDESAPEGDVRAIERFGAKKKCVPRIAAQRLMADKRYLDYLASTPSFVPSASDAHFLKSKYRSPAQTLGGSMGVSEKTAARLSSIAQIALTGMQSGVGSVNNPDLLEDPHLRAATSAAKYCKRHPADTLSVRCFSR